jgi:hypothetical protein
VIDTALEAKVRFHLDGGGTRNFAEIILKRLRAFAKIVSKTDQFPRARDPDFSRQTRSDRCYSIQMPFQFPPFFLSGSGLECA